MLFLYMIVTGIVLIIASFMITRKHYLCENIEWMGDIDLDSPNYPKSAKWLCNLGYLLVLSAIFGAALVWLGLS